MPALLSGRQDLTDARESLAYWEGRAQRLPLLAVRRRREARELARRWRGRVAAAERERYGPGLLGTAFMLLAERRLPQDVRHTRDRMARRTAQAFGAVVVTLVGLALVATVTLVEALSVLLHAVAH